jgi:two-component system chemotaxis response regulator CheB
VVKEAEEKEPIRTGYVYFAPPNYHLLIEDDLTFALSIDAKVNYSRPSIDVLFESAVHVYGSQVVAIILTGANNDGAQGIRLVKAQGGLAIVQDPQTADSPFMPKAALEATPVDGVLSPREIGRFLLKITQ